MHLSIVTPIYNEEESIPHLVKTIHDVMGKEKLTWELICVNDGSSDDSEKILDKLAKKHPALKAFHFRRNYGQTAAMQAGFDHAKGDVIVTLDADLQNDPRDIPLLLKTMKKEEADIVSGWRKDRKDKDETRKLFSRIANNYVVPWMTGLRLSDTGCSLKAYKKDVLQHVKIYGELHRFIPAVASQFGAKVVEVPVRHHDRQYGTSKYGLDRTFRVLVDLMLLMFLNKFLHRPMHLFGYGGLMCLGTGGLMATYLTALKLFGADIGGRPLLLLSVMLILIGVQLLGMGILGELLVRIYHEPQGRKQYILK